MTMKHLSECHYEETICWRVAPAGKPWDGPSDPIQYCTYCDKRCETISHECPGKTDPWECECEVFAEAKFFCPYAAIPILEERQDLPACSFHEGG